MKGRTFRKITNGAFLGLSMIATLAGLLCLAAILWTLISHGIQGMNWQIFTAMTPPPGSAGGLLNALYGSAVMTLLGVLIGSPIGVCWRDCTWPSTGGGSRLSTLIRFINDVLLSAPSIIIGLFIYEIVVVRMGHFSALAGALALAVLAIPVTLRTTEDMLNLVPLGMKDSSAALGAYPWRTTISVLYPAARSGIVTGLLLAIARISGETAPLLFTALNNQFLEHQPQCADGESAGGDIPVCLEPYKEWQNLAWAGALIITVSILILSISARVILAPDAIGPERAQVMSTKIPKHLKTRVAPTPPEAVDRGPPKIEIKSLNFFYGEHQSLHDINMRLADRSITAFIGSVRLRQIDVVARAEPHVRVVCGGSAPKARYSSAAMTSWGPTRGCAELRYRVGMVFQKPTPFPMSVFDNVAFGLRLAGGARGAELKSRVESALRDAALWDEVKDKLQADGRSLSGGQQQRLCIARAVAVQPEVLLLDEPTAALDPISTLKVEETLQVLREKYCIVIVTHNLQQAARVSNDTGFMYLGELVEMGPSNQIFTSPKNRKTDDYITGRFG